MKSDHQDNSSEPAASGVDSPTNPPPRRRPKNIRPPLPDDYKELCALCRAGKLFAVQDWFKTHKYDEPVRFFWAHWPIGIAIERGFHSLVEVLLQNGVPVDGRALLRAVRSRRKDMIELMLRFGATTEMVSFEYITALGDRETILMWIESGADLVTGYPIARGLMRQTRLFLGIYKASIEEHPELQFQADMALRHFCKAGSLRGVSLMMWLGANPRAKVPQNEDECQDYWDSPLQVAAWQARIDVFKCLKPDPAIDDLNDLLGLSIYSQNIEFTRYLVSLGADKNYVSTDGRSLHHRVMTALAWGLDPRGILFSGSEGSKAKRFTMDWFTTGAKWNLAADERREFRQALTLLSYFEVLEFIKLLLSNKVMTADALGEALDTPKLRDHLKERRAALAALLPRLRKWVRAEERKSQRTPFPQIPNLRVSNRP